MGGNVEELIQDFWILRSILVVIGLMAEWIMGWLVLAVVLLAVCTGIYLGVKRYVRRKTNQMKGRV